MDVKYVANEWEKHCPFFGRLIVIRESARLSELFLIAILGEGYYCIASECENEL